MKLTYRVISNISVALLVIFSAWAALFYFIIIDEINDETDDALEDYSEYIITRALAGEELPSKDSGTNNSYYIEEVPARYAEQNPNVQYLDEMVYIYSKKETEPARILKTIFRDSEDRYYELTVSIPTIEKADLRETILIWIIILYVFLLAAIIAVNAVVLRRSFRPLYALLEWLDEVKLGKDIPPLDNPTDITEFRKLNETMMRSVERNAQMYREQSMFIGHASHELQTPLAICQNRLEALSDDPGLTENQLGEIIKTRQTLEQASRLNKTLLLLARIENGQFPDSSLVTVNTLINKIAGDFGEIYAYKNIGLTMKEEGILEATMNESLASVLFSNLIKNAYVHNVPGGSVSVIIRENRVEISNTGTEALNPEYIFRRFYQGEKREGSAGLGLSLAASICKLYGIGLSYSYSGGEHLFTATFPKTGK